MTNLVSSLWIGSLFLQVTSSTMKLQLGSKFGKIGPETKELAAPERLKKSP